MFHISAPGDYADVSNEVTFSSGSTDHTIVVNIVDDNLLEVNEVFKAVLGFVNGNDAGSVVLDPVEASVTILDNDGECMEARELMYFICKAALSLEAWPNGKEQTDQTVL